MDIVTMAMNLYSRGIDPELDFSRMKDVISTVEHCTEIATHPRHPYAGELVFTAFSGSHQDAIRKSTAYYEAQPADKRVWDVAYLPIDPRDLGRRYEEVVRINSQSGKGGVLHVLERDFGITLPRWLQIDFSRVVQEQAEKTGGEVESSLIRDLFDATYIHSAEAFQLVAYDTTSDAGRVRTQVALASGLRIAGEGRGTLTALVDGLSKHFGVSVDVESFDEMALGAGIEARAMACVKLRVRQAQRDSVSIGVALAEDTTSAVLKAVLAAIARVAVRAAAVA